MVRGTKRTVRPTERTVPGTRRSVRPPKRTVPRTKRSVQPREKPVHPRFRTPLGSVSSPEDRSGRRRPREETPEGGTARQHAQLAYIGTSSGGPLLAIDDL